MVPRAWLLLALLGLAACAPVPPPARDAAEPDPEQFPVRIRFDPAAPQAITGYFHMGQVFSETMGSAGTVLGAGSPQDLDLLIDSLRDFTDLRVEWARRITYSDPRLLDLPIIVPQSRPNQVELQQLTRYLLAGGFVLDRDLGFDVYREGLVEYGDKVWGDDAWTEWLDTRHPIYSAYFQIEGGQPRNRRPQRGETQPDRLQALFVDGRLAGVRFSLQDPPIDTDPTGRRQLSEEEVILRTRRDRVDTRRQQMAVNIVVYALTQEGSLARRRSAP